MADESMEETPSAARLRYVTPNARFQHVFVVVRIFRSSLSDESLQDLLYRLSLTKAFTTEAEANAEAMRLNELNGEHSHYYVDVARLVPPSESWGGGGGGGGRPPRQTLGR
jgi:hypothetical protein